MKGWRGPRFGMRQGPRFPMRRQFQRQGMPQRMGGLGGQRRIGFGGSQYRMLKRIQMKPRMGTGPMRMGNGPMRMGSGPMRAMRGRRPGPPAMRRRKANPMDLDKEMDSYWSKCNNKEIEEHYNFNNDELEAYRNNFSTSQQKPNELKGNQTHQIQLPKSTVNQEL